MDPNAALKNILNGHLVADHVEALQGWLRGGGFRPDVSRYSSDTWQRKFIVRCETHFGSCPEDQRASANAEWITFHNASTGEWVLAFRLDEL